MQNPKQNKFCTFLDHIRDKKDEKFEDIEVQYSKKSLSEPGLDCKKIVLIKVKRSENPVYSNDGDFFIRTGNSTQKLNAKEAFSYITKHWM